MSLVLKNALIGDAQTPTDILIVDGLIAQIGAGLSADEVIDASGLVALPGLVDLPVAGDLLSRSTRRASTREVVVLLRATVIPAGSPDILFSEAL